MLAAQRTPFGKVTSLPPWAVTVIDSSAIRKLTLEREIQNTKHDTKRSELTGMTKGESTGRYKLENKLTC